MQAYFPGDYQYKIGDMVFGGKATPGRWTKIKYKARIIATARKVPGLPHFTSY